MSKRECSSYECDCGREQVSIPVALRFGARAVRGAAHVGRGLRAVEFSGVESADDEAAVEDDGRGLYGRGRAVEGEAAREPEGRGRLALARRPSLAQGWREQNRKRPFKRSRAARRQVAARRGLALPERRRGED